MSDTLTAPAPATTAPATTEVTPAAAPQVASVATETPPTVSPTPKTTGPLSRREAKAVPRQIPKASVPAAPGSASPSVVETPVSTPAASPEAASPTPVSEPVAAPTTPAPVSGATPTTPASPTPTTTSGTPTVESAPKPLVPTPTRIEIGADHPATRGRPVTLTAASADEEAVLRALVNGTYYRVRDVTDRDAKIADLTEKLARREAGDTAQEKWQGTPEYKKAVEEYHSIKETVGPEAASQYWKGIEADFQRLADSEFQERWGKFEAESAEIQGQRWAEETERRVTSWVPKPIREMPEYVGWLKKAITDFDAAIGAGMYSDPADKEDYIPPGDTDVMHRVFTRRFQAMLTSKEAVRAALKAAEARQQLVQAGTATQAALAKQKEDRLKTEAVEEYKRSLAQTRAAAPPNPLAAVGSGLAQPTPVGTGDAQPDLSGMSSHERKRVLKTASREAWRARTAANVSRP